MLSSCFATKDQCNSNLTANAALICQSLLLWKQKLTTVHFIFEVGHFDASVSQGTLSDCMESSKKCLASQENSKDLSYITKNSISATRRPLWFWNRSLVWSKTWYWAGDGKRSEVCLLLFSSCYHPFTSLFHRQMPKCSPNLPRLYQPQCVPYIYSTHVTIL